MLLLGLTNFCFFVSITLPVSLAFACCRCCCCYFFFCICEYELHSFVYSFWSLVSILRQCVHCSHCDTNMNRMLQVFFRRCDSNVGILICWIVNFCVTIQIDVFGYSRSRNNKKIRHTHNTPSSHEWVASETKPNTNIRCWLYREYTAKPKAKAINVF